MNLTCSLLNRILILTCRVALLAGLPVAAHAIIAGPYAADTNTLVLLHLDEPAGGSGTTNAGTLGKNAYSVNVAAASATPATVTHVLGVPGASGFGNAAIITNATLIGWDANGSGTYQGDVNGTTLSADRTNLTTFNISGTNAFTIEALVNFSSATGNREIVCTDSSAGNRGFQFRVQAAGNTGQRLEFNLISGGGGSRFGEIPNAGDHAFALGVWYHAAVAFQGTNCWFYWTVLDPTNKLANLVSNSSLTINTTAIEGPLVIGNENRAAAGELLNGMIDEVRLSKIARGAGQMMFFDPSVFLIEGPTPANQTVAVGQPFNLNITGGGLNVTYQWRHEGTNIPGATSSTYAVVAATVADGGAYTVVLTNSTSALTSSVANVSVRSAVDSLVWNNNSTFDYNWDTATLNWSNGVSTAFPVAYQPGDHVRFDDTGLAGAPVVLTSTIMPGSVIVDNTVNIYSITGPGKLSHAMSLTKSGPSGLTLESDNDYTGGTTVNGGTLQVGLGGATGTVGSGNVVNHSRLLISRTGTLTIPGNVTGSGFIQTIGSGTVILTGTGNAWGQGPDIIAGTVQIGDGGPNGSIGSGAITNEGTFVINSSLPFTVNNPIQSTVGGLVRLTGSATQTLAAVNSYLGGTEIRGAAAAREGVTGAFSTGNISVGGGNQDTCRLELTGGQAIANSLTIGPRAYLPADATPPNSAAHFLNVSGNNTLNPPSAILLAAGGNCCVLQSDSGTLTLTTGVTFSGGGGPKYVLLQGNGNGEVQGDLTQSVAASLNLHKLGAGVWTLSGSSSLGGPVVVSNGTLVVSGALTGVTNGVNVNGGSLAGAGSIAGPVNVGVGGTLAPGASIGTLTVTSNLTLAGTTRIELNKASATSDQVVGISNAAYGGTLVVTNLAGTLNIGDAFPLFSAQSASGNFASIVNQTGNNGIGFNFNPATGLLSVTSPLPTTPTNITFSFGGSTLTLSWPANYQGWILQTQTNSLSVGIVTNSSAWFDVPGSAGVSATNIPVNPANPTVFYRLRYP